MQKSQLVDINKVNLPRSLKYMDRLAMNSSVENRVPFLDHNLAKFVLIWEFLKIYQNQTRYIMKELFKNTQFIISSQKEKNNCGPSKLVRKRVI